MAYRENPKTRGSGIICAIPQAGECPMRCADCFFQSGRSYLEPLAENLPNVPMISMTRGRVVRMNDGNDSNVDRMIVILAAQNCDDAFFNTSIPKDLDAFPRPVVLTVNPTDMTDKDAHFVTPCPPNLMFVRFRTNTWNLKLADDVVQHYTERKVPVVLTFMAYYGETVPPEYAPDYSWRQRTLNSYWVITPDAWDRVKDRHHNNPLVYTCGKDANTHACSRCGNCLREYFATKEKMRNAEK